MAREPLNGGSFHLHGLNGEILFFLLGIFLLLVHFVSLDLVFLMVFINYFLDKELAQWSFYLAFQLVAYYALSFFLEKEECKRTLKKRISSFVCLLSIQLIFGLIRFNHFYLQDPLKIVALFSGACIIFISIKSRTDSAFKIAFSLYFLLSLVIGTLVSPANNQIFGIPCGLVIFVLIHFWLFMGVFCFKKSLLRKRQAIIPFFFSGLFLLLTYFPELASLNKWIEGIDLLLFLFGLYSIIEEEEPWRV